MFKFIGFLARGIYRLLKVSCVVVFGVFALLLVVGVISASMQKKDALFIADGSALEIPIEGFVVEEAQSTSVLALAGVGGDMAIETVLLDITRALDKASKDDRISAIVFRLDRMFGASPAALTEIGLAIEKAKEAGKTIYAYGDFYTQAQYYLASFADEAWMNPSGVVSLTGYGIYPLYYKEALDKYGVTINTFRAGTFKSFIEPYTRTNMSPEARAANESFLGDLWANYTSTVAENIGTEATLDTYINDPVTGLKAAGGDSAKWALDNGLVSEVLTRDDVRRRLAERFGKTRDTYSKIDYRTYLTDIVPNFSAERDTIAVLYAAGQILDGEQPPGSVGGDTLAKRIRQAASNSKVKAIVLRVDSPGGSAFASEIIRQELVAAKAKGIKIVASFGGSAASGGYWIATAADKIIAHPTTITGSIGVFAVAPSFETALGDIGVRSDGVATTPLAGAISPVRGISDLGKELLQLGVDQTYRRFVTLVADARGLSYEEVDAIAQGRVWSGAQAKERGLVDDFGTLNDAIELAAALAEIEDYNKIIIKDPPTPAEQLLQQLKPYIGAQTRTLSPFPGGPLSVSASQVLQQAKSAAETLNEGGVYARCLECLALAPAQRP
jgi:protease-4